MVRAAGAAAVVSTDENFVPPPETTVHADNPPAEAAVILPSATPAPASGAHVKVYFKNGRVVEGKFIEQGSDFVKIDYEGVPMTYYSDEVERVE